jgi:hypothetical protein
MIFGWLDVEVIEVSSKRVSLKLAESTYISQHLASISPWLAKKITLIHMD